MNKTSYDTEYLKVLSLSDKDLSLLRQQGKGLNIYFPLEESFEPALRNLWLALQDPNHPLDTQKLSKDLIELLEKEIELFSAYNQDFNIENKHDLFKDTPSYIEKFWDSQGIKNKKDWPPKSELKHFFKFCYERAIEKKPELKSIGLIALIYPLMNEEYSEQEKREILKQHFEAWAKRQNAETAKDIRRNHFFLLEFPLAEKLNSEVLPNLTVVPPETTLTSFYFNNVPDFVKQYADFNFHQAGILSIACTILEKYQASEIKKNNSLPPECTHTNWKYIFVFEGKELKKILITMALYNKKEKRNKVILIQTLDIPEVSLEQAHLMYYPGTFPAFKTSFHLYMSKKDKDENNYPESMLEFTRTLYRELNEALYKKLIKKAMLRASVFGAFTGTTIVLCVVFFAPVVLALMSSFPPVAFGLVVLGGVVAASFLGGGVSAGIAKGLAHFFYKPRISPTIDSDPLLDIALQIFSKEPSKKEIIEEMPITLSKDTHNSYHLGLTKGFHSNHPSFNVFNKSKIPESGSSPKII